MKRNKFTIGVVYTNSYYNCVGFDGIDVGSSGRAIAG